MDRVETELAAAWVRGWVVSRGTPQPEPTDWGLRIEVGQPRQIVRHVVFEPVEAVVRPLVATVTQPATWLKTFVEPDEVRPFLTPGWRDDSPGWLMAVDLAPTTFRLPEGYTTAIETADGVTRVRVLAADGSVAAAGQYGRDGDAVTVDQVSTEVAHQRKGLGSAVMRALQNAAFEAGVSSAVLGATVEGRALYETLGWKVHAPLAGFIFEG